VSSLTKYHRAIPGRKPYFSRSKCILFRREPGPGALDSGLYQHGQDRHRGLCHARGTIPGCPDL